MNTNELKEKILKKFSPDFKASDVVDGGPKGAIFVFTTKGNRMTQFGEVASFIKGTYIRGNKSRQIGGKKFGSKTGAVILKDGSAVFTIFLKSEKGPTEKLRIKAADLANKGPRGSFEWAGSSVKSFVFKEPDTLQKAVVQSLKSNPKVSKAIEAWVLEMFRSNTLSVPWPVDIDPQERNELGKYLGELLIGVVALRGKMLTFATGANNGFPTATNAVFHVPDDVSLSGIDSLILDKKSNEMFPISSKAGKGASASIWTNLMTKAFAGSATMKPSVLRDFIKVGEQIGINSKNITARDVNKKLLYEYGVRKVLGLSRAQIRDPYKVYQDLKSKKASPDIQTLVDAIKKLPLYQKSSDVKKNMVYDPDKKIFPQAPTKVFSTIITELLNKDRTTIEQAKAILSGKAYYQASLDLKAWAAGETKFKLIKTSINVKLKFMGNKGSYTSITSNRGTINYQLS